MPELTLKVEVLGNETKIVQPTKDQIIIGRLPDCDIQLAFADVSRHHARFFIHTDGEWYLEDLGSKNGTQLNSIHLTKPQKIHNGDTVVIVQNEIILKVILTASPVPQINIENLAQEGITIVGNPTKLQQQWLDIDSNSEDIHNYQKVNSRLKSLVEIAKSLNYADSIAAIFAQVKPIVFREIKIVERLALLIDINGSGQLQLMQAAAKTKTSNTPLSLDDTWISRSICQKVFNEKVAIKTSNAQADQRFENELSLLVKDIRSALAVPLWDKDQVVGVLYGDAHLSFAYWQQGGDDDLSFFAAVSNLVAASVQRWLLTEKLQEQERLRRRLERYHSPIVVQQLMSSSHLAESSLVPQEAEISILFADLVGFTAMSERLKPSAIAELLNAFFEEMLQEVFAVDGTLDKFIGDCIMAFFGAPRPQIDHADRAVQAAKGMLTRLARLNTDHSLSEQLQLRIAINSGKAVVGDVGSSQRVDYTVLGGTINLASRMESICPVGNCVISQATYDLLTDKTDFQLMGEHRFKGIDKPISVYHAIDTPLNIV